ncbi:MAG: PadR family transcriptional regulator [Actinomycetales bacterium]|jgi:DNA-binding PadR family transcriptional regulator
MANDRIKGNLDLLLLAALAGGPAHGYELAASIRARSAGEFVLAEGTVYPALHGLESRGLITSSWEVVAGRRRRVYELSGAGRDARDQQAADWQRFVGGMNRVLGASS